MNNEQFQAPVSVVTHNSRIQRRITIKVTSFVTNQVSEDQMQDETAFVIGFKSLGFGEELSDDYMTAESKMSDAPLMSARQLSTRDVQQLTAKCTCEINSFEEVFVSLRQRHMTNARYH